MIHVGYILKKFPRLSETFVLGELLAQEAAGTSVHVFSRKAPDEEPRHPELARLRGTVEELPNSSVIDPWAELFGFALGSDAHPLAPVEPVDLARLAEVVRELRSFGLTRLPRLVAEALYLRRRAAELGLEHLHAHFATDSAVVALIVRALGGPPYSITAHAKDIYRDTVDRALLARLVEASAFTVTVCDANVRHLETLLPASAAVRVRRLYNGLHLDDFAYHESPREPDQILSIGRLVAKKGFDVLIDALGELRGRGRRFCATIVGDGEDRAQLEERARTAGLRGVVTFTGALDQRRVREHLARATVFCLPCVVGDDGNRDALPTVLLEALATGLPCISTPVTGIPEILARGQAGVIVPERDVVATADAMAALLDDRPRRIALARAGRARAEQLFDARRSAATLHAWLAESCERSYV
jgi:colanic acid/amylovoran biosynthesis glycosyltransferase